MKFLIYLFCISTLISCSKGKTWNALEMFDKAFKYDSSIEEVRTLDPTLSIKCAAYPAGCVTGSPKRFKIRLVDMIVVKFKSERQACEAAVKIDQYYTRNWLLDDVKGEPVLEDFVKKVYDAKNPTSCD